MRARVADLPPFGHIVPRWRRALLGMRMPVTDVVHRLPAAPPPSQCDLLVDFVRPFEKIAPALIGQLRHRRDRNMEVQSPAISKQNATGLWFGCFVQLLRIYARQGFGLNQNLAHGRQWAAPH